MPHIVVEYTDSLSVDIPKLLTVLHNDLATRETVDIHAIKTRAIPVKYTIVGDGQEPDRMIHITLRLLPGRPDELKCEMSQGLAKAAYDAANHDDRIKITAEIVDMHGPSYIK